MAAGRWLSVSYAYLSEIDNSAEDLSPWVPTWAQGANPGAPR
jgi:hypothetical protein